MDEYGIDGTDGSDSDFETRPHGHDSGVASNSDESCVSTIELLGSGSVARDRVSWSEEDEEEEEEDSEVATDSGDDCLRTSEDSARSDAPGQPKEPGPTAFQGQ